MSAGYRNEIMNQSREKSFWIEYGAALWALIFAALHIAWAFGWYVGLDAESASKAFERGWFLAYNLIAAGLCAAAVAVALALIQSRGKRFPRSLLNVLAWSVAGILTLRGAAAVVTALYFAAVGRSISSVFSIWDAWFCLGAILFGASVWRFRRVSD